MKKKIFFSLFWESTKMFLTAIDMILCNLFLDCAFDNLICYIYHIVINYCGRQKYYIELLPSTNCVHFNLSKAHSVLKNNLRVYQLYEYIFVFNKLLLHLIQAYYASTSILQSAKENIQLTTSTSILQRIWKNLFTTIKSTMILQII